MKSRTMLLLLLLLLLLLTSVVQAQSAQAPQATMTGTDEPTKTRARGDRVSVFGEDIHIPADVYQDGTVVAIFSDAVVEGDVRYDVVVVGGNLELTGDVRGSVVSVLSSANLEGARIDDQLVSVAGQLRREDTSVGGQIVHIGFGDWLPDLPTSSGFLLRLVFWSRVFRLLGIFVLVVLIAALMPERVRRISEQAPRRYVEALFVGLLGYLGMLILFTLLTVTVIGLPIAVILFVALKWLGVVGILHALGERIGRSLGREMSLLGAVLLVFAPYVVLMLLPFFFGLAGVVAGFTLGGLLWLFLEVPALGLVLLSRAGGPPQTI